MVGVQPYFTLTILSAILISGSHGQQMLERSLQLSDQVTVEWMVDFSKQSIQFLVTAETLGFIGFGLSPQGGMNNADVIIGGVGDNGEPYFTDRFASGKMEPKIDDHQDWFLLDASENSTHTILRFNRSLDTCDPEDLAIGNDTTKFIWSLGTTDQIAYHGEKRGTSSVLMLDPAPPVVDTSKFDVWKIVVNTTIPTADTSYWCTMHKSPKYSSKRHIVGFKVMLDNAGSMTHNHHLVVHKCIATPGSEVTDLLESYIGHPGGECYDVDGTGVTELMTYCESAYYVWAKGGDPLFLPENVGFPLNEDGVEEYYFLEIHYDNPQVLAGVTYETGVEVFLTEDLREMDAGLLILGQSANIQLVIPPEAEDYVVSGHCSDRCTGTTVPEEGLEVFNVLLHAHLSGRKIKLRQFRPDAITGQMKELPWIYDNNYDFNYQQNRPLKNYMKILPGDHLTVECTYNSTWRSPPSVTLGGLTTRHEMCETFLMYYPRNLDLDVCASNVELEKLLEKVGIEELDYTSDYKDPIVLKPDEMAGLNFSTVLDTRVDWSAEFREEIQNFSRFANHIEGCFNYYDIANPRMLQNFLRRSPILAGVKDDEIYFTKYPETFVEFVPPASHCDA